MAKITRQPTRKTLPANEIVINWIKSILTQESLSEFTTKLKELIAGWPIVEEKTDLFHWSDLLNRFDEQLEKILSRCIPTGKLQCAALTEEERALVFSILEFSRILLETCSSRNIYNSYDRLNDLLRCQDTGILEKTLELLLIPARKIESQKSLSDKFDNLIDYRVVEALAQCVLPPLNPPSENENIELQFAYSHSKLISENSNSVDVEYCRLLALAIYLMMSSDIPADVTGFSINPTIIADTAKLLSASPKTPEMKIETGALSAMRGFLKFDSKWTETIYSMDATASHGPIATIFKTISNCILENRDIPYNQAFMMAFFDLATSMANCAEFDEALVTSTVIDDIVRSIPTCEPKFYKTIDKLISVLDPLIQFMTDALDAFFGADGLSVIVKHIAVLCELIKSISDESEKDAEKKLHISYLSSLLKFILKLLKQFGSNDRLRNLIEGSLFKSVKLIFESQILFGADVFYSATHILATFIHTEPTSLSILQEGGVPQALLSAISENPIPPNAELLIILPQAFDAICLNSSGVAAFIDSDPLPNFLRFLSSPEYFRELQQNHSAVSKAMAIGEATNEFMRHHPNLSSVIIPNLVEAVDLLQATFRKESSFDVDSFSIRKPENLSNSIDVVSFETVLAVEGKRRIDPVYISMMESLCLFIESIVKTPAHRDSFLSQRGVAKLLECYVTPTLPGDFTNSQACASINHCFHVLAESDPVPVMADIHSYIAATKDRLEWFMENKKSTKSILFDALVQNNSKDRERVFSTVQSINVFGSLVALLADLCFAQHMNFSRSHAKVVPAILEQANIEEMMQYIGHLMRCCLFEYWTLRKDLPKEWLASACRFSQLSPFKSAKEQEIIPVPAEIRVISGIVDPKLLSYADPEDIRIKNLKACLTILRQVPTSVIGFFSGLARSLASRRTVSTVLAELSPEQVERGLKLLINSVEFYDFVREPGRCEDIYLRNRLISAGISLTNLIFIDESNFKMTLHMQALGLYRSMGCFERMSLALEQVFQSINTENPFEMISVNDVLESIYGVLGRITDETLLRGNFWDEADSEKYQQLPYLFEFSALWTGKVMNELSRLIPLLSIECIQLILTSSCNLLALRNSLHVGTNLCQLLEELRAGKSTFTIDKVQFTDLPRMENFIGFEGKIKGIIFESLIPSILDKSKDLSFDLAQLLTRFSVADEFFNNLTIYLLDSSTWSKKQVALNSQLIAIILNTPFRCEIISGSKGKFEDFFFDSLDKIINSEDLEIVDRNLLISSFSLCSVQILAMSLASQSKSQQIPTIKKDICSKIYCSTLKYLQLNDLSVDAVHALLMTLSVLTKDQELPGIEKIVEVLPIILRASTKCLESEDSRHKTTVSLVALILRHLVETPVYLTALFQQELTIRFKGQHEPAFEIEDLIAFAEPFLLRSIPSAKDALNNCFAIDVISESSQKKMQLLNVSAEGEEKEIELNFVPLYSLKSSLSALLIKRQEKLENSVVRSNENFTKDHKIEFTPIEVPKTLNNLDVMKVLKNPEMSPLAVELISCLIDQLMLTDYTIWPQSSEELKSLESDEKAQSAHYYRCALLLFLSELILAYPVCHSAFLSHPKTSELIEFLLNVMTPYGNVRYTHINQAYERSWVQYLLINTCMGSIVEEASLNVPGNKMLIDKLPACMADSCKFATNCLISKLKKTLNVSEVEENKELKIGKIFGLSDTIFCLLTIKSSTVGRWAGSMTAHLASILIENRVINLLSMALQFIDSNNPAYEEVTVNVVRTLEALCKYSNKFSKLAAKKSGNANGNGVIGDVTDFSRLLQDFSSDDSGFSDDYGYESGSEDEEDHDHDDSEDDGIVSDTDMSLDDSEMDSDDMDTDTDVSDSDDMDMGSSDMSEDSDYDSDEDIIEIVPEIDMESGSGDLSLSSVRGMNTRIGNSGPYELIVEELDEEDSDSDGMGGTRGFPVGMDDSDDDHGHGGHGHDDEDDDEGHEYDYDHHHRHHMHHGNEDDFDSDEHDHIDHDHDDEDDDEDDEMMMGDMGMGDDDDWNEQGGHGHMDQDGNIADFMEFSGGRMRISRSNHRGAGHGRHRNDLNALLNGLNAGNGPFTGIPASYSGQVRLGADSGIHPLMARPVLDPLADPLRAHLPLTQPVQQTARPMSVVFGRSGTIEMTSGPIQSPTASTASSASSISRVNAEPFHFPQAVATNRRWQQDIRFTFSDLTRLICSALKSDLETILSEGSEELRTTLKALEVEEDRILGIIQKASEEKIETSAKDLKNMQKIFSDALAGISAKIATSANTESSVPSSPEPESVEFIDEGMDAEFFQAVPVDLYEEVIQQHLVERRNNIPAGCNRVTISADFLNRIPQIARDMYVRMSDEEVRAYRIFSGRSSRTNSPLGVNNSNSNAPSISGLSTPSGDNIDRLRNLVAEVNEFLMAPAANEAGIIASAVEPIPTVELKELPLSTIQSIPVVDPSSLVSMLRSYYSPVISERRLHHKLFQSLVANPRTRIELINLLIYVLERMPADMVSLGLVLDGYVESLGAGVGTGAGVSEAAVKGGVKRSRSGSSLSNSVTSLPGTPPPHTAPLRPQTPLVTDAHSKTHIPVLQRTLQLLLHLCSHDEDVCAFFTTPVEKPWTIKRHDRSAIHNKKPHLLPTASSPSSGPATMTITTKFPLVLVMACLERAAFSESSLLIEYLLHLLDTVTSPLSKVVNPQDLKIDIPQFLLNSLVRTLVTCEFTPKAFQYASHVFHHLSVLSTAAPTLLSDLGDASNRSVDELIVSLKELSDPDRVDMKKFSQSKAAPAKFLRLIKTTSSLCLQGSKEDRSQDKLIESLTEREKISSKLQGLRRFERELENLISLKTAKGDSNDPETLQFALLILPVIESFFLVHRLLQAFHNNSEVSPILVKFSEEHRGLLNSLIRTKPSLLTQGSLVTLTRLPRVLDFDNKRIFFRQQLHRKKPDQTPVGTLNITVQRAHVFEDSFRALQGKSGEELKWGRLSIKFAEEEGVDAGGVAREWFSVLARQMFNPDYALFRTSAADRITYQPNRMSYINPDHLLYFHFIGRIIGKAVFDSRLLDCHFTRSFYKHILRIPVETKDMEAVDPELYKSLCWIEENDITGVFDDLTFTTESDEFGTVRSVELKEDGANILVTEENKKEYVQLLTEFKLTTAIKPQIDAFLRGFHEIIPAHLISVFNEQEVELLISGMPEIDLDDWKAHCEYHGGYTIASPQIQWFWRAVRSFDQETRAKLIQFVTGTSKVPLEGFAKLQGSDGIQKFQIHRDPRTRDRLPTAHTCFNQLDLPEYETYEELRQQLLLAINEGETGFGFI